jgi:hypothetical protein
MEYAVVFNAAKPEIFSTGPISIAQTVLKSTKSTLGFDITGLNTKFCMYMTSYLADWFVLHYRLVL